MDTQTDFNAAMLETARAFTVPADRQFVSPQAAMVDYLWHSTAKRVAEQHGWLVMPSWIERAISHAWDAHGAEFIAIAEAEYARLKVAA